MGEADVVGHIDGQPVARVELMNAQREAYIQACVSTGSRPPATDEVLQQLEDVAWATIASRRLAADLGIVTGDAELAESMQREFSKDGVYNPETFQRFLFGILAPLGIRPTEFDEYYRARLSASKLREAIGLSAWITPFELSQHMVQYTDTFDVDFVVLPLADHTNNVVATDEDVAAFFDAHADSFMEPDRVRVKYMAFPISNYYHLAEITDAEVEEYFENNQDDYQFTDTNDMTIYMELATVRTGILEHLTHDRATSEAEYIAMDVVESLTPHHRTGKAKTFEAASDEQGLPIQLSTFFSRYESPDDMAVSPDFVAEAFELDKDDPEHYFSNPIAGPEHVFVIAVDDVMPAHIPSLSNVFDSVAQIATREKQIETLGDIADDLHTALAASMKGGQSFTNVITAHKLAHQTTGDFSWFSPPTNAVYPDAFISAISMHNEGELTDPIPWTNGLAIAHVAKRQPGTMEMNQNLGTYIGQALRQQRSQFVYAEWETRLMSTRELVSSDEDDEEDDVDAL